MAGLRMRMAWLWLQEKFAPPQTIRLSVSAARNDVGPTSLSIIEMQAQRALPCLCVSSARFGRFQRNTDPHPVTFTGQELLRTPT